MAVAAVKLGLGDQPDFRNLAGLTCNFDQIEINSLKKLMTTRSDTLALSPGHYFHIYNRANGDFPIFYQEENYRYFLNQYAKYLSSYLDTFAYCLLPNHFHFLVRVKPEQEILSSVKQDYSSIPTLIKQALNQSEFSSLEIYQDGNFTINQIERSLPVDLSVKVLSLFISNQFRRFFLSFSKAINKQNNRSGSLFQRPFRRKSITKHQYLCWLIWYIHRNPVHHKLVEDFRNYKWSSYQSILANGVTKLKREELLSWFEDGLEGFSLFHESGAEQWEIQSQLTLE